MISLPARIRARASGTSRWATKSPTALLGVGMAIALPVAVIISLGLGQAGLSIREAITALFVAEESTARLIMLDFRLPRILVAVMVGAQLAVSGAILQGVTRNALASPDLIGITAGAGLVAVILVLAIPNFPPAALPFGAFGGAVVSGAIVYTLAWKHGVSPERLALTGIAVTAIFQGAITTVVTLFVEDNNVQLALTWLAGSLYGREWAAVELLLPWFLTGSFVAFVIAHKVNLLLLGDEVAKGLGMRIETARVALVMLAIALAASAVAVTGTIGFVGLVIPHLVRLLVGADHRVVIPFSAAAGALLVLLADDIARTAIDRLELPAGLLTALLGAPYFIYLIMRSKTRISV